MGCWECRLVSRGAILVVLIAIMPIMIPYSTDDNNGTSPKRDNFLLGTSCAGGFACLPSQGIKGAK